MDERHWIDLGKKRILKILDTYRVSFQKHLEIKISEAGPYNQRVEPVLLTQSLRELHFEDKIVELEGQEGTKFIGAVNFGRRGDASRFRRIQKLYKEYDHYVKLEHYCGLYLEKLLFDTILGLEDVYHIIGRGPVPGPSGKLHKPSGSELRYYGGEEVYGNGGFDLFIIHRETNIPVGIEAKNIRNWLYPDTQEVWRMIARGCSVQCLPVLVSRKLAYLTRGRLFSNIGVLGFESQFQYFNPEILKDSKLFKEIIKKDGLGFADIKFVDDVPAHFTNFFREILPQNIEVYYDRFLDNSENLKHYAIEQKLAERMNGSKRRVIYKEFEDSIGL